MLTYFEISHENPAMSLEIFLALTGFSLVSSITPGPNNLMLLSSGVNYGFRRTIPHMLGISAGFGFMLICVGLGLAQLLLHVPVIYDGLKIAGGTYLLYLAYKIATSGPMEAREEGRNPMTFWQASAFQWVNPKAWVMSVTAMTAYTSSQNYLFTVAVVVFVFTLVNLPCVSIWCAFGSGMRDFLSNAKRLRVFNISMAVLLVISLWPMLA